MRKTMMKAVVVMIVFSALIVMGRRFEHGYFWPGVEVFAPLGLAAYYLYKKGKKSE